MNFLKKLFNRIFPDIIDEDDDDDLYSPPLYK